MKKRICILVMMATMLLSGCESVKEEENIASRTVIIRLADGEIIRGACDDVLFYSNGAVDIWMDGARYTTHSSNVTEIIEYR